MRLTDTSTRLPMRGFSLLELAVVLMVISIMLAGVLSISAQKTRNDKMKQLQHKLDTIETAIKAFYRNGNERLPCPANGTQLISSIMFGREVASTSPCTGSNHTYIYSSPSSSMGVVPTRTLGLADEYMFDPWGGRISYVVYRPATVKGFGRIYTSRSTQMSPISLLNNAGQGPNVVVSGAILLLISHGPNGHGAYQLNGVRKLLVSSQQRDGELHNCQCDPQANAADYMHFAIGPELGPTGARLFDDIVRVYRRADFLTDSEQKEPLPF